MGTRNKHTLDPEKRKEMPPRGKNKRTLILEAIKEKSLLNLHPESTNDDTEKAFFAHVAERAFDPEDQNNGMLIKLLMDKGWASVKPVMESVEFKFDTTKPHEQATQILKATSEGAISPDVANMLIGSVSAMLKIEEVTEIKKELEKIKEMLGLSND